MLPNGTRSTRATCSATTANNVVGSAPCATSVATRRSAACSSASRASSTPSLACVCAKTSPRDRSPYRPPGRLRSTGDQRAPLMPEHGSEQRRYAAPAVEQQADREDEKD